MFTGPGRFYRSIERQDVGLEGDAVNHGNDVANLTGTGADVAHGGDNIAYHIVTFGRRLAGRAGKLGGFAHGVAILADSLANLLHRGGGFLHAGGLLFGTAAQVVAADGDFTGAGGN